MRLYRNGFVVAEITNTENFTYRAWPLFDLIDDKMALALTDESFLGFTNSSVFVI